MSNSMNEELIKPYTKEEIQTSLFSIYPAKAPEKDGIPAVFYQKYWKMVGNSVINAYLNYLNENRVFNDLNHTLLALVPKVKEPKDVVDYRLISLCNVLYKIISKTIANGSKKHLPSIILAEQSAFVPG